MTQKDIAKSLGVHHVYLNAVIKHRRTTPNIDIAIEAARVTGENPLNFIDEKKKDLYLKAYPDIFGQVQAKKGKKRSAA